MKKNFLLSKTFWFNLLVVIVAVAGYFGFGSFQPDADTVELAAVLVAVLNIALRFVSKLPLKLGS